MSKPREFWIKQNNYDGAGEYETFYHVIDTEPFRGGIHVREVLGAPAPSKDEEIRRLTSERNELVEILKHTSRAIKDHSGRNSVTEDIDELLARLEKK